MGLILIGDRRSKSVDYFERAAGRLGVDLQFMPMPYGNEIDTFAYHELPGAAVKIDPPRYDSTDLLGAEYNIRTYRAFLERLRGISGVRMLNTPEAILDTLDKRKCKEVLSRTGVAITPVLADGISDFGELREWMLLKRKTRVFIKPVFGSGACGVMAYRIHPVNHREVLYTSALPEGDTLYNTKKLRRFDDSGLIERMVQPILRSGAIIEEWLPKARYRDKTYDLRVVWQFDRMDYLVARQSSGPITNLHLNNDALEITALGLPPVTLVAMEELCKTAVKAFSGLQTAGIDILLTPGTLTPYIIEINAQGDLIYQDIYNENRIYRAQLEYMSGICPE